MGAIRPMYHEIFSTIGVSWRLPETFELAAAHPLPIPVVAAQLAEGCWGGSRYIWGGRETSRLWRELVAVNVDVAVKVDGLRPAPRTWTRLRRA